MQAIIIHEAKVFGIYPEEVNPARSLKENICPEFLLRKPEPQRGSLAAPAVMQTSFWREGWTLREGWATRLRWLERTL